MIQAVCGKCGRPLKGVTGEKLRFLLCTHCGTSVVMRPPRTAPQQPAVSSASDEADEIYRRKRRRQRRNTAIVAFGIVGLMVAGLVGVVIAARSRPDKGLVAKSEQVEAAALPPWRTGLDEPAQTPAEPVEVASIKDEGPVAAPARPARPELPHEEPSARTAPSRPPAQKVVRQEEEDESPPPKAAAPASKPSEPARTAAKPADDAARGNGTAISSATPDRDAVAKVKRSTVLLRVKLSDGANVSGSGFFAHEPGLVITNAHVLGMLDPTARRPRSVQVVLNSGEKDSRTLAGKVLGVDRGSDLGVVQVDSKDLPPPLPVIRADKLVETQDLYIYGFPFGEQLGPNITVAKTSVSSLRKSAGLLQQIQVNGGMHPGNSGGPLTDAASQVVGVAVSALRGTQIQFAIPGERVHYFLNGRAVAQEIDLPYRDGEKVKVGVNVEMIDPLGRVQKVAVEVWTADAGPVRRSAEAEPEPVAGDSPKHYYVLTYDKQSASAKGEIELPKLDGPKKQYWVRPVFTNGAGETRWLGVVGKALPSPVERREIVLRNRPEAGARASAVLVSNADFKLRSPEGGTLAIGMNLRAGLEERVEDVEPGKSARLRLSYTGFGLTVLEDGKPLLSKEDARRYAGETRSLGADLEVDGDGGIVNSRPDFSRVPRASRAAMEDISDQVLQSLEVLSVPLPGGTVKPLQTWKGQRHVRVGALGIAVPGSAEVTYTYLGTETKDGKTMAVVGLSGKVRGIRGDGLNVGGTVNGSARVVPETGQVLSADTTIKADLDVDLRRQHYKALGTLSVQVKRGAPGSADVK